MNDWRYIHYIHSPPRKAHLWELARGGVWRSLCGRAVVIDLSESTYQLPVENGLILRCKRCIPFEVRRKESA